MQDTKTGTRVNTYHIRRDNCGSSIRTSFHSCSEYVMNKWKGVSNFIFGQVGGLPLGEECCEQLIEECVVERVVEVNPAVRYPVAVRKLCHIIFKNVPSETNTVGFMD